MDRTEFVNQVFQKLEENHINLYHDISKEEFEKHKQSFLNHIDSLDETHFEGGILKLFALFKDAHTCYRGVKFNYTNANFALINKTFYIKDSNTYKKIEKVNGYDIKNVVKKLKKLIPYEVETWAYHLIARDFLLSPKALKMIDCGTNDKKIDFMCDDGKIVTSKVEENPVSKKNPLYESKKINDNILYIRYKACKDMKDYPFSQFVEDIKKEWKKLPKACLVDVRSNIGGSDGVILPLVKWLGENDIKSYMLMNEGTFSAGIFALADFKKDLNATLIGVEAGQPTKKYGNCRKLEVDGKTFTASEKYFALTTIQDKTYQVKPTCVIDAFDYTGVVKPDIRIEFKLEDINKGIDTQLEESLKIIEKDIQH